MHTGNAEADQQKIQEVKDNIRGFLNLKQATLILDQEQHAYKDFQDDDEFKGVPRVGTSLGLKPELYCLTFASWLSPEYIETIWRRDSLAKEKAENEKTVMAAQEKIDEATAAVE